MPKKPLTKQQEMFCRAMVVPGATQTTAYIEAYGNTKTARVQGCKLMRNPAILERIEELREEAKQRIAEAVAKREEIAEFFTKIMRGETTYDKTSDRIKAAELLGKYQNMFVEKVDVNANMLDVNISVVD